MNAGSRVLYLAADAGSADAVATRLTRESEQIAVETVTDADEALDRLGRAEVDCVLVDDGLVHPDGYDRLARLGASAPDVPLIVAFEGTNSIAPGEVLENGATDYVLVGSSAASYDVIARRIENAAHRNGSAGDAGDDGTRQDRQQRDAPPADGSVRDVSERAECERELEYFETIVEGMGETTFVTDEHGEHRHVNTAGGNITGYTDEELVQGSPEMLYDDEDIERFEDAIGDLLANPEQDVAAVEATMETKSGETVPVQVTQTLRRDERGRYQGTFGVVRDISERKQTERKLHEHESILRAIPDEIAVIDTDGYLQRVVPPTGAGTTATGYEPEEMEGEHIGMVMPDETLEESIELVMDLIESDRNRGTLEHELVAKDGDRLLREAHVGLLTDDEGSIEGSVSILRDIEERKERERELREYESIAKAIPDEVVLMNLDGFITRAIPPVDRDVTNSGYTPEEIEGMHVAEVMGEESLEYAAELVEEMIETDRERATFEMKVLTKDGDRLLREDHTSLLEDDEGNTVGTVGVLRDIEERKAYERELERQNERLEQFASITSHDLRNPLNLAQGYMEMVEDACDVEHTEKVADSLDRMEKLIEDTLTWARQGSTVSERKPVALGTLAPDCWEAVGAETATLDVVDDVTVEGDPSRVRQVIENLLRNAVEHGGEDVHVEIGAIDGDDPVGTGDAGQTGTGDAGRAGFYVADDGPGIPPDQRDSVFDAGFTTASDGTGFGLAIIGEICDAHGWEISVTDSESGGVRFEITDVDVEN